MWPTLTVKGNYNRVGSSSKSGDGLITALLPTLTASTAASGKAVRGRNAQGGPSLGEALLPTLTVRDYRTGNASEETWLRPQARPLNETLGRSSRGKGCLLDPGWCEAFMGFPEGWTDPGDAPDGPLPVYEPPGSPRSETPSCPPRSSPSGG